MEQILEILGWSFWGLGLIIFTTFLLNRHEERGATLLSRGYATLLGLGLAVTLFGDVSKLHLLWWAVLAFPINLMLFALFVRIRTTALIKRSGSHRSRSPITTNTEFQPMTVARAQAIVEHAENEYGTGQPIDYWYTPFEKGGAASPLEALQALYIVIAQRFLFAKVRQSNSFEAMTMFDDYVASSRFFSLRVTISTDKPSIAASLSREMIAGLKAFEKIDSFVLFLRTLCPSSPDYWPQVYARLELDYPSEPASLPRANRKLFSDHKVWWFVLVVACSLLAIVSPPNPSSGGILWADVLGRVVGAFTSAFILAGVPWLASIIARRRMTTIQLMWTFTAAIGLVIASRIVVLTHENNEKAASGSFVTETMFDPTATSALADFASNSDMVHHRDETNGYAIWFPKSWAKVPTTHAGTKLKISNDSGRGGDDFNVVVVSDPAFQELTPERLVEMTMERPEAVFNRIRKDYPDATVVSSGKTNLDSKPAFFVIFDGTFRSFDVDLPIRFLQVCTVYNGRAYYLTSRTDPTEFDAKRSVFALIMAGFRFLER
jgi:hypothetical protein